MQQLVAILFQHGVARNGAAHADWTALSIPDTRLHDHWLGTTMRSPHRFKKAGLRLTTRRNASIEVLLRRASAAAELLITREDNRVFIGSGATYAAKSAILLHRTGRSPAVSAMDRSRAGIPVKTQSARFLPTLPAAGREP